MDKTNDSAVLSLRLQGAALAELTERAQYVGKTRSRFARELIMKALAVPAPARTIFRSHTRSSCCSKKARTPLSRAFRPLKA